MLILRKVFLKISIFTTNISSLMKKFFFLLNAIAGIQLLKTITGVFLRIQCIGNSFIAKTMLISLLIGN